MIDVKQPTRLVIFGYGNPSRGDDALGPTLLHQGAAIFSSKSIEFIEDFQLQIEHALDLVNRDLALFIDASVSCPPPFTFTPLLAQYDVTYTTHALHPAALLQVYQQTQGQLPPPAFLLTIRGESFELGESLSQPAAKHLSAAFNLLKQLCEVIDITVWQQLTQYHFHYQ